MLGISRKKYDLCDDALLWNDRPHLYKCGNADRPVGATLKEINIMKAVEQHFADIGHDPDEHNVVYETHRLVSAHRF